MNFFNKIQNKKIMKIIFLKIKMKKIIYFLVNYKKVFMIKKNILILMKVFSIKITKRNYKNNKI